MTALYTNDSLICKLREKFFSLFSEQTKPTREHLFDLMLSIMVLDGFQSVKFNFEHFVSEITDFSLNSYYFTLNQSKIDLIDWMRNLIQLGLSLMPLDCQQPLVLSIDDTLVEKYGEHFACYSKLFDHAAHHGNNYLNGHCFVSLMLSVPVQDEAGSRYLSIPIAYRMWTKEKTKLEMAAELVQDARKQIGRSHPVILCCDSWYPKGPVKDLVNCLDNFVLICNVRSDTAIYELPPIKTGRGRPPKRGKKLTLSDIPLDAIPDTDWLVGSKAVKTKLFGDRVVYALVTKSKSGNARRLFLCTENPDCIPFDLAYLDKDANTYAKADPAFLPLSIYHLRWNIEVSYYEQKTFWALGDYMLRSKIGIERLINLQTLTYSMIRLLPWSSTDFSFLKGLSTQQARFTLGKMVYQRVFFATFVAGLETDKNSTPLIPLLKSRLEQMSMAA